jgi:hypothetical protein
MPKGKIMHYVYLTNNVVTDQAQVNPFNIFAPGYASQFIEAPDEVTFEWKLENGEWVAPPPPPPPDYSVINKSQAESLLQATDWVELGDVSDPINPPYLTNKTEFTAYRAALRAIAVNPPDTPITNWPVKPDEIWST